MSEGINNALSIYYWDDFRHHVLAMQGLSEKDLGELASTMQGLILESSQKDPVRMFFEIIKQSEKLWLGNTDFPIHGDWHHLLVPGVILSALRNSGFGISDKDIVEGMQRGAHARISCGFTGICGGANSIGTVSGIIKKANPLHDDERQEMMLIASQVLREIARIKRRCCKRSSYIALKETIKYLAGLNYLLPDSEIKCSFSSWNRMCAGQECPFN